MSLLARVKILHKIAAVIALIGVIVGGCVWHTTGRMQELGVRYAQFIDRDARAAASARRINRFIYEMYYTVYRTIAERDPEQIQRANAQFELSPPTLRKILLEIEADQPAFAEQVGAVRAQVERFISDVSEARSLGEADLKTEALDLIHRAVDPNFNALIRDASKLGTDIASAMEAGARDVAAEIEAARRSLWSLSLLGLLAGFAAAAVVAVFGISRPLGRLVAALERMARGEETEIAEARRSDEIGAVGRAVEAIRVLVARKAAEQAELARAADIAAEAERRRATTALADAFEAAVGGILGTVSASAAALEATAAAMSATAGDTAGRSASVAAAAEETSQTVAAVAAAAEELGASVDEIGRQATDSAGLARTAVADADETGRHVAALNAAVAEIGDVAGMISQIAGQTNLLALNATIEAARAGAAGRGFAVVAAEVKELASQTARATETIGRQIAQVQTSTDEAARAIGNIGTRIRDISGVTAAMAASIEQQGLATQEIVAGVAQAATGSGSVTETITGVAGAAEETGAAALRLREAAGTLAHQSDQLSAEVGRFLATVRAA